MKTLTAIAAITAIASSAAFAANEAPVAPAFGPAYAPVMTPAYVTDMRADFEKQAADMRTQMEQRSAAARAEVEEMIKQARAGVPAGFTAPEFPAAPAFATPNTDMVKFMEEQRAAAEARMEEMRKAVPAAPQFQAPTFQAPVYAVPVATIDPAEANKIWAEQAKAYAEAQNAVYEQFQAQMKAQQEAVAAQFGEVPAAPVAPTFQGPMDHAAMMEQMETHRAAAEKRMQEARARMEQMQSRTL